MTLKGIDGRWFADVVAATEVISLLDADDRVLYVSLSIDGDYLGQPVFNFVDPGYHASLRDSLAGARATGLPHHFSSSAAGIEGDTHRSNWVVALGGDAGAGMVAVIATDISHTARVEAQLLESQTTFGSLVDNSPDAILIADTERKILFANKAVEGDKDAILGQLAEQLVAPEDRETVVDSFLSVVRNGDPCAYRTGVAGEEGSRCWSTRLVPILKWGKVDRIMLVATDITAQVKAEHEQQRLSEQLLHAQKMEAIGQLTGALAHDFNNLLLAVRGNLELSELPDTTEQERAVCVETALEALTRAGTLTARLLAFSRKQVLQPKSLDVGAFVKDMQKLLVGALGETVSVRVNAPLLMSYCQVDPVQLESAVLNLAINARDAMPDGGELQIGCAEFRSMGRGSDPVPAGNYVLVQVSDTGSGMSADTIAHAFEPFFTTKDVGHGTGLGLSMVHGFVNQSGGHVRILSEPSHGTMVEIYLPVSEQGRTSRTGRRAGDGPVRGDRQLILLVEDNEMVRTLTARMLKRLGYRVVVAEDADAALKRFEEDQDIALLLTDVVLPGGQDGCQLAQLCRKKRPKLPVVLVSGYPRDALPLGGSEAWSPLLLRKPYTTGQMADHLSQAFDPGTVAIRRAAE